MPTSLPSSLRWREETFDATGTNKAADSESTCLIPKLSPCKLAWLSQQKGCQEIVLWFLTWIIPATYGNQHVGRETSPVNILTVLESLHGELWTCFRGAAIRVAELMLPFRSGAAPQAAVITAIPSLSCPVGIGWCSKCQNSTSLSQLQSWGCLGKSRG